MSETRPQIHFLLDEFFRRTLGNDELPDDEIYCEDLADLLAEEQDLENFLFPADTEAVQ